MMRTVGKLVVVATVALTVMIAALTTSASSSPSSGAVAPRVNTGQAQEVDGVYFLSPTVGWASVDGSTRLLMTADGGAAWRDVSPPMLRRTGFILATGFGGCSFLSPTDFFVSVFDVGRKVATLPTVVLHTTDGGKKWVETASLSGRGGDTWVRFFNDRHGWAEVGDGLAMGQEAVTIYQTTSGGKHWSVISRSQPLVGGPGVPGGTPGGPPFGCDKTGFSFSGSPTAAALWLTGASAGPPCLARSTDGGRRWIAIVLPNPSTPEGGKAWPPVFSSASNGALSAWYGTAHGNVTVVYSTADGGATWVEHRTPTSNPALVDVVSATTWFAAIDRTIYWTTNKGASWSSLRIYINFGYHQSSNTLDFVNVVDGWAVLGGALWHTTDGGHMWQPKS